MKPISQLKIVADAVAVSVVDVLHKYRAGVFDEERLQQELGGALSRIEKSWADYSADHRTAAEREIVESLVPPGTARADAPGIRRAGPGQRPARPRGGKGARSHRPGGRRYRPAQRADIHGDGRTDRHGERGQPEHRLAQCQHRRSRRGRGEDLPLQCRAGKRTGEQQIQRFTVWQARQGASSPALPHRQAFVRRPAGCGRKRRRRPASG